MYTFFVRAQSVVTFFILPTTRLAVSFFLYKYLVRNNRRKYKPSLCFFFFWDQTTKIWLWLSIHLSIYTHHPAIHLSSPLCFLAKNIWKKITHTLTSCKARVLLFRSFFLSFFQSCHYHHHRLISISNSVTTVSKPTCFFFFFPFCRVFCIAEKLICFLE